MALAAKSSLRTAGAQRLATARTVVPSIRVVRPSRPLSQPPSAIELDFSDIDTQLSVAGLVLGIVAGVGAPLWYINRTERDEERLEELRAMNRATFDQTGEYMSEDDIAKVRKPKWTDRREWVDDD